ncbi:FAD-dependent urate hydroxylase [Podospora fimiseda]|uniref:FAD-dependent urate hydroxylase n=1 Tax=Podospora fimiseda TaxID=252190 RepID=A0AAN7BFY6_9PEZI|nr:FAD-dependent urate hydroxylase [Podospora fimiseda]
MSQRQPPKVIILGAGISGLTLAQLLRKQDIPFEVYEKDESINYRGVGYAIGLYDLESTFADNILPDDLPLFSTACHLLPLSLPSQLMTYFPDGKVFGVTDCNETRCLRASRAKLREEVLSRNIKINWGKRVINIYEEEDDGGSEVMTVEFQDGSKTGGDIIVGADGTFSRVREIVLRKGNKEVLRRVPMGVIVGQVRLGIEDTERQLGLGHSVVFSIGEDEGKNHFNLFVGLNKIELDDKGVVEGGSFYWILTEYDEGVCEDEEHWGRREGMEEKLKRAKEMVERGLKRKELRLVVERTGVEGVKSGGWDVWWDAEIEGVPSGRGNVVLIGDAAHPMTPIRGEGAIYAMRDAVALSKVIAKSDIGDMEEMKAGLDKVQKEIIEKGLESIRAGRAIIADGLAGAADQKMMAWGHELRMVDRVEPLPIKLM